MAEQMIDEIYELCKRVQCETNAFVRFQIYAHSRGELKAKVNISEKSSSLPFWNYDFVYFIDSELEHNMFDECKAHLKQLLKIGIVGC